MQKKEDRLEIKCAIIDDEPLALGLIKDYVERTPSLILAGVFSSASEALPSIMSGDYDLVFLDINMPGLTGIELGKMIPSGTRIIYITAYDRYAIDGYKVNALDYLLKPVNYPEFMGAVSKAFEWKRLSSAFSSESSISKRSDSAPVSIMVKSDYRLVQLILSDILYVEVRGDKLIFNREGDSPLSTQMSLKEIEDVLPPDKFIKVHRSFIVNLDKVKIVERSRIVFGKTYIPVSDTHKVEFMRRLNIASK